MDEIKNDRVSFFFFLKKKRKQKAEEEEWAPELYFFSCKLALYFSLSVNISLQSPD